MEEKDTEGLEGGLQKGVTASACSEVLPGELEVGGHSK